MNQGVLKGLDYDSLLVKYRGERVVRLAESLKGERLPLSYVIGADIFYALYLPAPILNEDREETALGFLVSKILTSKPGVLLRSITVLNALTSYLAAAILLLVLEGFERAIHEPQKSVGLNTALGIEKALAEVYREVETVDRLGALIEGLQPGTSSMLSFEDYALDLLRLARDTDVKEILKYLQGVKHWNLAPTRKYWRSKRGEKLGYTLGSDIERLAPRTLAYPDELFYVKLAEGRLLLYEKGVKTSGGTIYVLVDKSGSMEGEKIIWAKAVALALYAKAARTARTFMFRFFDSQPHSLIHVRLGSKASAVVKAFEYIARVKSAGGTDISRAVQTAIIDLEREKSRDATIVLITDGIDRVAERPIAQGLKRARARLLTVMIKGDNQSLKRISEAYLTVEKTTRSNLLNVVRVVD